MNLLVVHNCLILDFIPIKWFYNSFIVPTGLVRLALVRCKDGSVLLLIRQRNGILSVRFQPLVNLFKVDDPSLAGLGARDFLVCKFLVDGCKWNVGVPGNLLWCDRAMSVLSLLDWSVLKVQLNEVNLLQNLLTGIKSKIKQLCTIKLIITASFCPRNR